jgi:hypothetical protein
MGAWRKSSYSGSGGGQCVEVGAWRKSSYSGSQGGQCVEAAAGAGLVLVRDTTNRSGTTLAFTADAWQSFLTSVAG